MLVLLASPGVAACTEDCPSWVLEHERPDLLAMGRDLAVGRNGSIVRPAGLRQYEEVSSPSQEDLLGVAELPLDETAVIVGRRGTILLSSDRGKTWEAPSAPGVTADLNAVHLGCTEEYRFHGTGIIVGDAGTILVSRDGGESWQPTPWQGSAALRDVAVLTPDAMVAVGDDGTAIWTEDAGATWNDVDLGTTARLVRLASWVCGSSDPKVFSRKLIAATEAGGFYETQDGGRTWSLLDAEGEVGALRDFHVTDFDDGRKILVLADQSIFSVSEPDGWLWSGSFDFGEPVLSWGRSTILTKRGIYGQCRGEE